MKKTMTPVSILIHSEAPHDSKIFNKILQNPQKKRQIIKRKDIILFNQCHYGYKNYQNKN